MRILVHVVEGNEVQLTDGKRPANQELQAKRKKKESSHIPLERPPPPILEEKKGWEGTIERISTAVVVTSH
jgi:hypothetical protein